MQFCFLLNQVIRLLPRKKQPPDVLLRSSAHPTKSASQYPTNTEVVSNEYQRSRLVVLDTYFSMHLAQRRYDSQGSAWYLAHTPTVKAISG